MQCVRVNPMHIHACGSGIGLGHLKGLKGPFVPHDFGMRVPPFHGQRHASRPRAPIRHAKGALEACDFVCHCRHKFFGFGTGNEHARADLKAQAIEPTLPEDVLNGLSFVEPFCHQSKAVQLGLVPTHVGHHPFALPFTADVLQQPAHHATALFCFHLRQT